MRLKAQMEKQEEIAINLKNKAKRANDRDAEMIYFGIRMAMGWALENRKDEYYLDEEYCFPIEEGKDID